MANSDPGARSGPGTGKMILFGIAAVLGVLVGAAVGSAMGFLMIGLVVGVIVAVLLAIAWFSLRRR